MKFKYIHQTTEPHNVYGHMLKNGDVVEFDGHLVEKATRNPDFEQVKPGRKKVEKLGDQSGN